MYSCRYVYTSGVLTLSVKELADKAETDAYFASLATKLGKTENIKGLGQGAFTTKNLSAVVRKDYKVLTVDISGCPPQFGTPPDSRGRHRAQRRGHDHGLLDRRLDSVAQRPRARSASTRLGELAHAERLHEVVVGAGREPALDVFFLRSGGEQQHGGARSVRGSSRSARHTSMPRQAGHHPVENDEIGLLVRARWRARPRRRLSTVTE